MRRRIGDVDEAFVLARKYYTAKRTPLPVVIRQADGSLLATTVSRTVLPLEATAALGTGRLYVGVDVLEDLADAEPAALPKRVRECSAKGARKRRHEQSAHAVAVCA